MKKEDLVFLINALKKIGNLGGIPDEELPGSFSGETEEPDWWRDRRLAQEYEELLEKHGKQNMIRSSEGGRERIPSMKLEPGMDYNMRKFEPFTFESGGIFTEINKRKRKRPAGSI